MTIKFVNADAGGNTIALPEHCSSKLKKEVCGSGGAVENSEDETSHRDLHLLER